MGNGISRTYPVGIIKSPPKTVRFGKPEVRLVRQDSWETMPLLNTHEVARLEAKIRTAPEQPMQPPKPVPVQPAKEKQYSGYWGYAAAGVVAATIATCCVAGPIGLIIPVVAVAALFAWNIGKGLMEKPPLNNEQKSAAIKAIEHLEKLIQKHERAGLTSQALVYQQMLNEYRKRNKV